MENDVVHNEGDEPGRLRALLGAEVRDQDDLERDITRQADRILNEQANERDHRRLDRTKDEKAKLDTQLARLRQRLAQPVGSTAAAVRIEGEIHAAQSRMSELDTDLQQIQERIDGRNQEGQDADQVEVSGRLPGESRREYLIRTGKITPFSRISDIARGDATATLQEALIDAEEEREEELALAEGGDGGATASHRHLLRPGFEEQNLVTRPSKRRKVDVDEGEQQPRSRSPSSDEDFVLEESVSSSSTSEAEETEEDSTRPARGRKVTSKRKLQPVVEDLKGVDDGNEKLYRARLRDWTTRRSEARDRAKIENLHISDSEEGQAADDGASTTEEEYHLPHPTVPDADLGNGFRVPGDIFPFLFDYQKTGVRWLWELYQQRVGGIIGDEMGLGKTIQAIAFLAGLHYSKKLTEPVIVVCPPTVMKQWVDEFHQWWPPLRVSILHTSGSGMMNLRSEGQAEDRLMRQAWDSDSTSRGQNANRKAARRILKPVLEEGHVLVTTYAGLQTYSSLLIPINWACVVLDEGHKIRNPDTAITIHCKELRTPHRLILSGTPMQNNLTELWSLFDFVFPMRLGTLVNFRNQFEFPIRQGGYANASNLQVQTAAKCAETLKDAISPYLLQRFKTDVAADLPKKSEQVLFCKLTKIQRAAYEAFLASDEMSSILRGRREALYGIDMLRKICNHPDLQEHKTLSKKASYNYGSSAKSGKMQIVKSLLELWKDTGHKALVFAQHRIMLDILERMMKSMTGFTYRRMDGNTPIKLRQTTVDEFNNNPDIHVFLLTTKVGGLGVNLTGADRVIIYDPDWNPSTDVQARERAWRLGQKRDVTIYRLMTAGTIEEKIYHRQIFKQFLTNKILRDPKQRQTFQMSDIQDLFSLGLDGVIETSQIFKNAESTYSDKRVSDDKNNGEKDKAEEQQKVSNVTGVVSLERYRGEEEPERNDEKDGESANSDARLVESIFSRSGVLSALEHDQILGGKRTVKADPKIIEAEARRVAQQAAKELLKAEEVARTVPAGTPTWTGQSGRAGRPEDARRIVAPAGTAMTPSMYGGTASSTIRRAAGGPSSASLLANLASRSSNAPSNSPSPSRSKGGGGTASPSSKEFMAMIRDYIVTHGGAVYTQMLVDHFNRFCDTPRATVEFKEMLRTIAVLEKTGGRARGRWVLKPEYRR